MRTWKLLAILGTLLLIVACSAEAQQQTTSPILSETVTPVLAPTLDIDALIYETLCSNFREAMLETPEPLTKAERQMVAAAGVDINKDRLEADTAVQNFLADCDERLGKVTR